MAVKAAVPVEARVAKALAGVAVVEKGVPLVPLASVAQGDAGAEVPPELVVGVVVWEAPVPQVAMVGKAALVMSLSRRSPTRTYRPMR
jgi:hypothetical protein